MIALSSADRFSLRRRTARLVAGACRGSLLLCFSAAPLFAQFETRAACPVLQDPYGIAVGDFNHDGKLDMAVASILQSTQVSVLLGNGDGTFRNAVHYAAGPGPRWVAAADINRDGNLDLAVADFATTPNNVSVLLGNGDGTFRAPVSLSVPGIPSGIAVGDFNGDKKLDLAVTNWVIGSQPYVSIFLGNGDGTFQPSINNLAAATPLAIAIGDFNGDGRLDAAVGENNVGALQVEILSGNGDGTLKPGPTYGLEDEVSQIVAADFRGNGKLDLAVAGIIGPGIQVLLGNGDGTFQTPVNYATFDSYSVAVADLNGDGKLDMAVANFGGPNGAKSEGSIFLGNGDGTFQAAVNYPIGKLSTFVAVGDFNNDKLPDLVFTDGVNSAVDELLNTGAVTFSPTDPVSFATQLVGTASAARTVTVTNTGKTALTISSMQTSAGPFTSKSNCGSQVAAGAKCEIGITFLPTSQGKVSGFLTLHDSASSKPQVIELEGIGTVAEVVPGSLNFGTQKFGTESQPQTVTLTNTGSAALSVTGVGIYGGGGGYQNFHESNNCPASLAPQASCSVSVTFDPGGLGTHTARVDISDNGGGDPQKVQLTGVGTE